MKQELYLGIDGGGTKTTASIVTSDGHTAASGNWPGLNYNSVGPEQVTQVLTEVLNWAQGRCAGMGSLRGICVATAGAGNAHARRLIRETVTGTGHCGRLLITGDHTAALMGALGCMEGIVLIAGTGSICYGVNRLGQEKRAGGWGHIIDDPGSGYDLGRQILSAVAQAYDGRGPRTVLTDMVFEKYSFSSMDDLIAAVYAPSTGKREIAGVAALLEPALVLQDAAALIIQERAASAWIRMVLSVAESIDLKTGSLALCGGVLQNNPLLRGVFLQKLAKEAPLLKAAAPKAGASVGAAWMLMAGASCPSAGANKHDEAAVGPLRYGPCGS